MLAVELGNKGPALVTQRVLGEVGVSAEFDICKDLQIGGSIVMNSLLKSWSWAIARVRVGAYYFNVQINYV